MLWKPETIASIGAILWHELYSRNPPGPGLWTLILANDKMWASKKRIRRKITEEIIIHLK